MNTRVLFSVFFRTYLVGAAFNTKGLQNIGFSYVVEPGLRAIKRPEGGILGCIIPTPSGLRCWPVSFCFWNKKLPET